MQKMEGPTFSNIGKSVAFKDMKPKTEEAERHWNELTQVTIKRLLDIAEKKNIAHMAEFLQKYKTFLEIHIPGTIKQAKAMAQDGGEASGSGASTPHSAMSSKDASPVLEHATLPKPAAGSAGHHNQAPLSPTTKHPSGGN
ncbi:hypothetical protein CVT24_003204 [Panaeolus cyanescens]|uniref:Uncharacterized protein n=1 Tax=Panaeolus cyanescens TaxID=181874 RepID=A0A409YRB0_9AGAR|nr:hypothetical protein CVT24_003204 [Panaeolus cyanescens]